MMQESIAKVQPIDDDEIDLLQLVRTIWSGKWLIALFATIAVTISVFAAITIPPTYRADALMQLEDRAGQMSLPTGLSDLVADTPRSVTEMEIMRSRLVLGRAVAELHLDWVAEPRMAPLIGYPPNPSELLMRNTLASLVEELDKSFDLILFDCPPVLAVTDPLVVSGAVGTTLVVLRHEETQAEEVMALQRSVEVAGHKISGAILNGYVSRNQHSSYSYNYRYAYENRRD